MTSRQCVETTTDSSIKKFTRRSQAASLRYTRTDTVSPCKSYTDTEYSSLRGTSCMLKEYGVELLLSETLSSSLGFTTALSESVPIPPGSVRVCPNTPGLCQSLSQYPRALSESVPIPPGCQRRQSSNVVHSSGSLLYSPILSYILLCQRHHRSRGFLCFRRLFL
ncbi:hypothetical protein BaRGS_00013252 [Batillaria attramentaria]|uniref:Uncharacterized protein n=1 Tax=Batillaria attramentaria TaxID=370345 RepID=A0ABD0L7G8_9CAEN